MLETSKGDIAFIWDRRERHTLSIWDLPHINSTPLYPSSPAGKKLHRGHILTQNFEGDLRNNNKIQQHPLAGQQDPWEYCCLDLLLARNLLHRWASLASWQGNPSQLIPTLFLAPLSAQWVLTHLEPASMAAQDLPCSAGGVSALKVLYFLGSRRRQRWRVSAKVWCLWPHWPALALSTLGSLPSPPGPLSTLPFWPPTRTSIPRAGQQRNFICKSSLQKSGEEQVT